MMIEIEIGSDKKPSTNYINLGNQWENNTIDLKFTVPTEYESFYKYILGTKVNNGEDVSVIAPLVDNTITISTLFTQYEGNWFLSVMCRETELDLDDTEIDLAPNEDESIFCSDSFVGKVGKGTISKQMFSNTKFKFRT